MTRQELDAALIRLGLELPEAGRVDIVEAMRFIEEMAVSVRKPRSMTAEPAHIVSFTENQS